MLRPPSLVPEGNHCVIKSPSKGVLLSETCQTKSLDPWEHIGSISISGVSTLALENTFLSSSVSRCHSHALYFKMSLTGFQGVTHRVSRCHSHGLRFKMSLTWLAFQDVTHLACASRCHSHGLHFKMSLTWLALQDVTHRVSRCHSQGFKVSLTWLAFQDVTHMACISRCHSHGLHFKMSLTWLAFLDVTHMALFPSKLNKLPWHSKRLFRI